MQTKRLIVFAIAILFAEIAIVVDLEIGSGCFAKRAFASEGMGDPGSDTSAVYPTFHVDAIYQTPDISQRGMSNGNYCAPCASANLLYQFYRRGLISLPKAYTGEEPKRRFRRNSIRLGDPDRKRLAEQLGSQPYMETASRNGTNRYRLVNGFDRFLRSHCDQEVEIEYVGVRSYDTEKVDQETRRRLNTKTRVPQLGHLKERLSRGDGVIILFGSYKPNAERGGRLERLGGHYVIVVGYGANVAGNLDPGVVLLHDSNDGHVGAKFVDSRPVDAVTELWSEGKLLSRSRDLVRLERAPIRNDGRIAFLETVLSFRIRG